MTSDTPTPPPKPRRWLVPALVLSAAANLLVIGIVAGAVLSPDGPRKGGDEQRSLRGVLGEPFFRALPPEDRRAMVRDILRNREQFSEGREALRERVEGFLSALRAETFDRAEVERLLGQQRNAALRRQNLGEQLLLDRLEAMTQAERAAYADELTKQLKGLRRR